MSRSGSFQKIRPDHLADFPAGNLVAGRGNCLCHPARRKFS